MKSWNDFKTEKRAKSDNEVKKDLFKLMNNAVFGKTMENVRNHINFELITSAQRFEKVVNEPYVKHSHIINENLVGVEKTRPETKLKKPIYVGMSILELSKLHMYNFYYDVLKERYGDNVRLAYTDTDSYILKIETEDVYDDFKKLGNYFDFSNYEETHNNYDLTNNKKIGFFKDEMGGKIMTEYIGLKPKMYSHEKEKDEEEEKQKKEKKQDDDEEDDCHNKAKGIPKCKVKKLTIDDYKRTLNNNEKDYVNFKALRSYNHTIFTINCNKLGLSSYDNKRFWIDSTNSLAYGHYLSYQ